MGYLGYKWEEQVTILCSRITLLLQKEIKFYFFSKVDLDSGKSVMGFTLSGDTILQEDAEKMCQDLDCIHVNRRDWSSGESAFIVGEVDTVQEWYDLMRKGEVSRLCIEEHGYDAFLKLSVEELETLHARFEAEVPRFTADKEEGG